MVASTMRDYKKLIVPYVMMFTKIFMHFKTRSYDEEFVFKVSKFTSKIYLQNSSYSLPKDVPQPNPSVSKRKRSQINVVLNKNAQKFTSE